MSSSPNLLGSWSTGKPSPTARALVVSWHVLGVVVMLALASQETWNKLNFWQAEEVRLFVILNGLAYLAALLISQRMVSWAHSNVLSSVLVSLILAFLVMLAIVAFGRIYYSRAFVVMAFLIALVWQWAGYQLFWTRRPRLAVVPGGMVDELQTLPGAEWVGLASPQVPRETDGIVADLHAEHDPVWIRFIAECSLHGKPVYHAAAIYESLTGRASLGHHSEDWLGRLNPSLYYPLMKRLLDVTAVIVTLPLTLPIMLIIGTLVKLDSPGPVFFRQPRVGKGERIFHIIKFRTMRADSEQTGPRFASDGDERVTGLGHFLRKFRLDELPQFWNVFSGEMSLIGPRPEQLEFVRRFTREIPLYSYRHIVKPGLSGWAQVNQGYAANSDDTRMKLTYDLFYVKNLSFGLDSLIVLKTIRTILTGFGAR